MNKLAESIHRRTKKTALANNNLLERVGKLETLNPAFVRVEKPKWIRLLSFRTLAIVLQIDSNVKKYVDDVLYAC